MCTGTQHVPFGRKSQQVFVAETFICHSSAWNKEESSVPAGSVVAQCMLCGLWAFFFYSQALTISLFVPLVSLWHWLSVRPFLSFLSSGRELGLQLSASVYWWSLLSPSGPYQFLLCVHFHSAGWLYHAVYWLISFSCCAHDCFKYWCASI